MKIEPVSIEACFGDKGCPNSLGKMEALIEKLQEIIEKEKLKEFIVEKTKGKMRMHNTFRIGISNCPNACSQVHIKDFGIIQKVKIKYDKSSCVLCGKCVKICIENALNLSKEDLNLDSNKCVGCGMCVKCCEQGALTIEEKGYMVLAGGKLGRHPMLALTINNFTDENTLIEIFQKVIKYYKENNIAGERLGSIFQRKNINNLSSVF